MRLIEVLFLIYNYILTHFAGVGQRMTESVFPHGSFGGGRGSGSGEQFRNRTAIISSPSRNGCPSDAPRTKVKGFTAPKATLATSHLNTVNVRLGSWKRWKKCAVIQEIVKIFMSKVIEFHAEPMRWISVASVWGPIVYLYLSEL